MTLSAPARAIPTLYGGSVGAGDMDRSGTVDLVAAPGVDPAADTRLLTFTYDGASLATQGAGLLAFPGSAYGVNAGPGHFDD